MRGRSVEVEDWLYYLYLIVSTLRFWDVVDAKVFAAVESNGTHNFMPIESD